MRRAFWIGSAAAALIAVAAAAAVSWRGAMRENPAPQAALARPAPATPPTPQPSASALQPPSFDIVSIDPRGQAVIAGRAMPGDRVRVLDGDKSLGEVTADARGEWVLLPDAPIRTGQTRLALEAAGRDGGPPRRSADTVALSVAPRGAAAEPPLALAVLLPGDPNRPLRILQRPATAAVERLSLDVAETGDGGRITLSGRAKPGARLKIHAGDRALGTATADAAGAWSLTAALLETKAGTELRVEELAADGAVAQRTAAPLAAPEATALSAPGGNYIVARGNSLWLIARQIYGQGTRYTAIYDANRQQIRDPDRIYPGQHFKLPKS